MPNVLQSHGLHARRGGEYVGTVDPGPYNPRWDATHRVRNLDGARDYTQKLARRLGRLLESDRPILVVGGGCSILLGCCLALRRRGLRFGLVFVDGHIDMHTPFTSRTGGLAGMDLAVVTGRGLPALGDIDGLGPQVSGSRTVVVGCRDGTLRAPGFVPETGIHAIPLHALRGMGPEPAIHRAVGGLPLDSEDALWLHFDVDALHDDEMPAVDSRQPDGLRWEEARTILLYLVASDRLVGANLTIYDPDRDPTGSVGRRLATFLADAFVEWGR